MGSMTVQMQSIWCGGVGTNASQHAQRDGCIILLAPVPELGPGDAGTAPSVRCEPSSAVAPPAVTLPRVVSQLPGCFKFEGEF